jgi:hypothetical protein
MSIGRPPIGGPAELVLTGILYIIKWLSSDFMVATGCTIIADSRGARERRGLVSTIQKAFVETIEQAADGLSL